MQINPALRWQALAAAMLSLSIGWGIRGNFGHEAGAMLPGALCAIAVCLFSGREDWRKRVVFFALLGALGWAFGGSIAYMPPLGYTHSGHLPTQLYGFLAVFCVGFLWAAMGGAGTAYAALEHRERLTAILKPLAFILAIWAVEYIWQDDLVAWYERARGAAVSTTGDFRHRNPFYWLDSEWIEASLALLALCAWDLWDRRFARAYLLPAFCCAGALLGIALQKLLEALGWMQPLLSLIVRPQGDPGWINPTTGHAYDPAQFISNWPRVFFDQAPHLGWVLGLLAGAVLYFRLYGRWRSGALLLLYITMGSLVVFLAGPVLLSGLFASVGGLRLQPPRGDSWANILGAYLGMTLYMRRHGLPRVASAALVSGILGGLSLMLAQFLKLLAYMPGNPVIEQNPATVQAWAHWHGANWHSILAEQGVGLLYGLAIALPMAYLAARTKSNDAEPAAAGWAQVFGIVFVLNLIPYLNLVKNVGDWTKSHAVPASMKAPLFGFIELPALAWFNLFFGLYALATMAVLVAHLRRPLAVVPSTWAGKGQLLYLALLWPMVIGNFERALVAFSEGRLATEGTIFVNALLATLLVLTCNFGRHAISTEQAEDDRGIVRRTALAGAVALLLFTLVFTGVVRSVYGDRHDGWGKRNLRFGPEADWRVKPILEYEAHR